jgi:hypothetical protein
MSNLIKIRPVGAEFRADRRTHDEYNSRSSQFSNARKNNGTTATRILPMLVTKINNNNNNEGRVQGCTNCGRAVTPHVWGFWVWNSLYVSVLVPIILRRLIDLWEICAPFVQEICESGMQTFWNAFSSCTAVLLGSRRLSYVPVTL